MLREKGWWTVRSKQSKAFPPPDLPLGEGDDSFRTRASSPLRRAGEREPEPQVFVSRIRNPALRPTTHQRPFEFCLTSTLRRLPL